MTTHHTSHLNAFQLPSFTEQRGTLTVADLEDLKSQLGFVAQRIFWITDVPKDEYRGTHAHCTCWEALLAVNGGFKLKVNNGKDAPWVEELKAGGKGVVIPPLVWCELYDFEPGTVCLCLASGKYDKAGYLKNFDEFIQYVNSHD